MDIILYSNKIDEYLKHDNESDYDNEAITELWDNLPTELGYTSRQRKEYNSDGICIRNMTNYRYAAVR